MLGLGIAKQAGLKRAMDKYEEYKRWLKQEDDYSRGENYSNFALNNYIFEKRN